MTTPRPDEINWGALGCIIGVIAFWVVVARAIYERFF